MALARGLPDGAPPAYGLPAKAAAAVVNHRIIEDVVVKTESIGYGSRWPNEVEIGVQRNKAAQMRVDIRTRVNGSSVVGCALIVFQSVDAVRIIVEKPYQRERVRVSQRELVQYLSNQSMNPQAPHLCAASAVQRVLWYSAASAVVQCSECCGAVQRVLWCRLAGSFMGLPIGMLCTVGGAALLWWNESHSYLEARPSRSIYLCDPSRSISAMRLSHPPVSSTIYPPLLPHCYSHTPL